jgi:hypothetical protein
VDVDEKTNDVVSVPVSMTRPLSSVRALIAAAGVALLS